MAGTVARAARMPTTSVSPMSRDTTTEAIAVRVDRDAVDERGMRGSSAHDGCDPRKVRLVCVADLSRRYSNDARAPGDARLLHGHAAAQQALVRLAGRDRCRVTHEEAGGLD